MHLVLATATLRDGVTEEAMLAASERFEREFVRQHDGILDRILVTDGNGTYTDVVVFRDQQAIEEVMAAEQSSPVCGELMSLLEMAGEPAVLEVLQSLR